MNKLRGSFAALLVLFAPVVMAQSMEPIFSSFSRCDASFFAALKKAEVTVRPWAPTGSRANALWFVVPNRANTQLGSVKLNGGTALAGFPVRDYIDESMDLDSDGRFYTWGFRVEGALDEVARKLTPLVADGGRIRKDGEVYVRSELQEAGSKDWKKVNTAGGTVPAPGTVERVLLIEEEGSDKSLVRVTCSLQGAVTGQHLRELRPDIDEQTYPAEPAPVPTYETSQVAPALVEKILDAQKKDGLFFPKFKQIQYAYKIGNMNWKMKYKNTDGLVEAVEEVSPMITFQRQYLGSLVQVKYGVQISGRKALGFVSQDATLSINPDAQKGERIIVLKMLNNEYSSSPAGNKPQLTQSEYTCGLVDSTEAKTIFADLPGQALILDCAYKTEKGAENISLALIKDIGWVVPYAAPESTAKFKPVYTHFIIEK